MWGILVLRGNTNVQNALWGSWHNNVLKKMVIIINNNSTAWVNPPKAKLWKVLLVWAGLLQGLYLIEFCTITRLLEKRIGEFWLWMCVDLTLLWALKCQEPLLCGSPLRWLQTLAADFLNRLLDGFQGAKFSPNICKIMGYAFFSRDERWFLTCIRFSKVVLIT